MSTTELTSSFGWDTNAGALQQDIHELYTALVTALEASLVGLRESEILSSSAQVVIRGDLCCRSFLFRAPRADV